MVKSLFLEITLKMFASLMKKIIHRKNVVQLKYHAPEAKRILKLKKLKLLNKVNSWFYMKSTKPLYFLLILYDNL